MKGLALAARAMYLSWMIVIVLLIPTGVGLFVDRRLGTSPWGVLLFALVGTVLATWAVIRAITREYGRIAPPDTDSKEE
jgi:F0F1-type ATP synthase assembly protein I